MKMKMNMKKQVITGVAIGMMALGGGTAIYASEKETASEVTVTEKGHQMKAAKMDFDALVTKGIVSQETANKMATFQEEQEAAVQAEMEKVDAMTDEERQAYFESNNHVKQFDLFDDMVTEGIITQDEADAIEDVMPAPHATFEMRTDASGAELETVVAELVTDGVMDQATADEVIAYNQSTEAERKAEMDKFDAMSEAEREAYAEENAAVQFKDPISEMVAEGIITEEQGNAMKEAMPNPPKETHFMARGMETDLSSLVADGVISQATADEMTAYQAEMVATHKAEMEQVEEMTEADRTAYFEDKNSAGPVDPITDMVSAGVLTQVEADAIKAASGV